MNFWGQTTHLICLLVDSLVHFAVSALSQQLLEHEALVDIAASIRRAHQPLMLPLQVAGTTRPPEVAVLLACHLYLGQIVLVHHRVVSLEGILVFAVSEALGIARSLDSVSQSVLGLRLAGEPRVQGPRLSEMLISVHFNLWII